LKELLGEAESTRNEATKKMKNLDSAKGSLLAQNEERYKQRETELEMLVEEKDKEIEDLIQENNIRSEQKLNELKKFYEDEKERLEKRSQDEK